MYHRITYQLTKNVKYPSVTELHQPHPYQLCHVILIFSAATLTASPPPLQIKLPIQSSTNS